MPGDGQIVVYPKWLVNLPEKDSKLLKETLKKIGLKKGGED